MATDYKLPEEIIKLSNADIWDEAKLEWYLESVYWEEEPDQCLCGQYPINELCYLRNKKNGNRALVGNQCVKKFLGLESGKVFDALKRISKDVKKALNAETINHAHTKRWINDWERKFYMDTWRKRNLSGKQLEKRIQINEKILTKIKNARR